jgi:plastocyanin domain-containing protein
MVNIPLPILLIWMISLVGVGAISLLIWAFAHSEKDDQDDLTRKKVIKDIEEELDRLKKS